MPFNGAVRLEDGNQGMSGAVVHCELLLDYSVLGLRDWESTLEDDISLIVSRFN